METITAGFRSRSDLEQAAEELRKQGVIDLKIGHAGAPGGVESLQSFAGLSAAPHGGASVMMSVVVESSRLRQAEDTIARYGGQY